MTWSEAKDRVKDILAFERNWDGQGAAAPPNAVRVMAKDFADAVSDVGWRPPLHVAATGDGCIVFEWADGVQVDISMSQPKAKP